MKHSDFFKAIEPLSEDDGTLSGGFVILSPEERNNTLGGEINDVSRANEECSNNEVCRRNGYCANNKGKCIGNGRCVDDIIIIPPTNPANCFCQV